MPSIGLTAEEKRLTLVVRKCMLSKVHKGPFWVKLKRKRNTHLGILAEHIILNVLLKMVFYEHLTHAAKSKDFMLMGEFN